MFQKLKIKQPYFYPAPRKCKNKNFLCSRTNYNLSQVGIIHNQNRQIHAIHEKAPVLVQLKYFGPENLARVENTKSFTINKAAFTQAPTEVDISSDASALRALLNYTAIRQR